MKSSLAKLESAVGFVGFANVLGNLAQDLRVSAEKTIEVDVCLICWYSVSFEDAKRSSEAANKNFETAKGSFKPAIRSFVKAKCRNVNAVKNSDVAILKIVNAKRKYVNDIESFEYAERSLNKDGGNFEVSTVT